MNDYEERYDLDDMEHDEKNELILKLFNDLATLHAVSAGLHNCMVVISQDLDDGDALGTRARTMRSASLRLTILATAARMSLDVDWEKAAEEAAFEDIVSRFEEGDEQ